MSLINLLACAGVGTFNGDGLPGTSTAIRTPIAVFGDAAHGLLYFSDTFNNRIRTLDLSTGEQ